MGKCLAMIARAILKTGPRRCRLLYVEDHAESVALVDKLLAGRKDLLLLRAADANLGIKLARTQRPEAILIDVSSSTSPSRCVPNRSWKPSPSRWNSRPSSAPSTTH
jgi:hypothetical protein